VHPSFETRLSKSKAADFSTLVERVPIILNQFFGVMAGLVHDKRRHDAGTSA
jgi:hypothetical protein